MKRLDKDLRAEELLNVALRQAEAVGWRMVTRENVAQAAGVSPGLVSARLGTMEQMRRSIMRRAVLQRCVPVVAEGLVAGDAHARKADEALRDAAAAWVKR